MRKFAVASASMAQKALSEVANDAEGVGPVLLCGRSRPVEQVRSALLDAEWSRTSAVESYAIRRLRPDDRERLSGASVVVYGGEVAHALDDETRSDLEVVGRLGRPLLVALEGVDVPMDASVEAMRVRGIEPETVLAFKRGHFPRRAALRALASRLPALRPYVIERVVETAARRNGLVATAVWIPGADMPLLTAVDLRMVLQIGICFGAEVSADRAVELLGVLGAGLGFRSTARELLDVVPVAGWVIKGGVAYAGTRALGRAAMEYFERGAVADVSHLRALAERLRS
jgi:uncharacterized protein (DUF697 family)